MDRHTIIAQIQTGVLCAWHAETLSLDLRTGILTAGSRIIRLRDFDISHSRRGTTLLSSSTKHRRCRLLSLKPMSSATRSSWTAFTSALSLAALSPPGYRLLRALGAGGSGRVYLASADSSEELVAVKLIPRKLTADCAAEITMAKLLPAHKRLIRTTDTFYHRNFLVVVMQYVSGGSLLDFAEAGDIPIGVVKRLTRELLEAVEILHSIGIAHRDIKLENALLDENGALRVCDLGLTAVEPGRGFSRPVGTLYTQAPEMCMKNRYGKAVDLWSVGVVVLVMLLRAVPFTKRNRDALFGAMMNRARAGNDPLGALIGSKRRAELPDKMLDLLRGLLEIDPHKRLDVKAALRHPWFMERESSSLQNVLTVANMYMTLRRRVVSIRTKANVALAKRRLLTAVRMVGFLTELWTKAGLGRSSFSSDSSSATRRLLAAQPLCIEA